MALYFQFKQHCFFAEHSCFIPASESIIYSFVQGVSISCSFLPTSLIRLLFLSTCSLTSLSFCIHRFLLQSASINRHTLLMKSIVLRDSSVIFNQYLWQTRSNSSWSHFSNCQTLSQIYCPARPRLVNLISESNFLMNRLSPHSIIFYLSIPSNFDFYLTFSITVMSYGSITSTSILSFFFSLFFKDRCNKFADDLFLSPGSFTRDYLPVQVLTWEILTEFLGIVPIDLEQACFIFPALNNKQIILAALQLFRPPAISSPNKSEEGVVIGNRMKNINKNCNNPDKMSEGYLAVIQQLITENQTLKSANRKLTSLCQNVLDDMVNIWGQFFPNIPPYDSDCIFKAGVEIGAYYRKQLLIAQSELCKNLLHLLNIYGLEVEEDLENLTFDNLRDFVSVMKSGKGNLLDQLAAHQAKIRDLEIEKNNISKELYSKQIQFKKITMKAEDDVEQIFKLSRINQLLILDVKNLTNQLHRVQDDLQTLYAEHNASQLELNSLKIGNQQLRRQILKLEGVRMDQIFYSEQRI